LDPVWLYRNIKTSWRYSASPRDFICQLLLRYAAALQQPLRRQEWEIGFRYPLPIGEVRLLLRDNRGADLFIHSEVFEHESYRLPVQQPTTILDLGANIGLSAVYFARLFPGACLACVEPVPENLRILDQNLRWNCVSAEVFAAAADIKDGTVTMARHPMDYGHKIAASDGLPSAMQFEAKAITVPSLLRKLGWNRIGLLKIDIEGHETTLLSTACDWLHRVDALCVEYHEDGGEEHLAHVASRFCFLPPRRLPGGLWFLTRSRSSAGGDPA